MKNVLQNLPRYLLGLIYAVFGANGFLNFIPVPPMPENMMAFMNGLISSGYFFPLLKGTETILGIFLIVGLFPALSLVILAPITLNILFVHLFLTPGIENQIVPVLMIVMHALAAKQYWAIYKPMFDQKKI